MTKFLQNRPPNPSPKPPNFWRMLLTKLQNSPKTTIIGVSVVVLGGLGYWGTQVLVKQKLPPFLEQQISKTINRPVDLGEVESFSLTGIKFDSLTVPPTATDPGNVAIDEVQVGFNILPLIFKGTLPLEITLVQPDIYLEQAKDGSWLDLNLQTTEGKQSIYIDLAVNVEDGEITAVPYNQSPINVQLDGSGRYNSRGDRLIEYDLDAAIEQAKAKIKGQTTIASGQTNTKLKIEDLVLTDVTSLIPNSPIDLSSGRLNADLDIKIPSFEEITAANIEGEVNLQNVQGEVEDLSSSLKAKSKLNFGGRNAQVGDTQVNLGNLTAKLKGKVDLQQGYDLNVDVLPFTLSGLQQTLNTQFPVNVAGEIAAQLQLAGKIKEPLLTGRINNTKILTVEQTKIKQLEANFAADLSKFELKDLKVIPLAGGTITGQGVIETKIKQSLTQNESIDVTKMPLAFNFQANLPTEKIVAPYYDFPNNIDVNTLNAEGQVRGTLANPEASLQWQIPQASTAGVDNISGAGKVLFTDNKLFLNDTEVKVGEGRLNLDGQANLNNQQWQTNITASDLALTPFLSQLNISGINRDRPITLDRANINLNGRLDRLDPNKIAGIANLNLDVDGSDVEFNSQLASGNLQATANTGRIDLNQFIPNLPLPTTLQSSKVNLSGKLQQLLTFADNPNLDTIDANIDANLAVANGTINAQVSLNNNQWQTNINVNNFNSNLLAQKFAPQDLQNLNLDNLNGQIDLAGSINPLIKNEVNIPIQVKQVALQLGEQTLNAQGDLTLSNLTTNPDLAEVNLNLDANVDFEQLPIDQLIAQGSNNNDLLAEIVNIYGRANFQGKLQGRNLISAPTNPENINLTGNLTLNNFAFNDVEFDPVMTGTVNIQPASELAINLRGEQDVIAARVEPCQADNCRLPYLPISLELRQGEDTPLPVIATGNRQGEIFSLDIQNFPLALLNLAPGEPLGIKGALNGKTTGEINANLFTLATTGNVTVEQPAVGYIQAEKFAANFNYNPEQNLAEVATASLNFGQSQYNFAGGIDLQTGQLQGKLNIPQAYIQDILTTFRWFTLEDLTRLFQTPNYAQANQVDPNDIETASESLVRKLKLLRQIENQIQAEAAAKQKGQIPTDIDILGAYQGEILLAGTINNPQLNFNVEANNWEWQPQLAFADIVPPLGFIKEETQFIAINQILIKGIYQDNTVNLEQAKIQIEDTVLALQGQLSPTKVENASFQVENLSVDTIGEFVNIPVDVAGKINSTGKIQGTFSQPKVEGEITFSDGAYNGQALPTTIAGNYNYTDSKLQFQTTEPSSIQVDATVPYPIQPGNDTVTANLDLGTEAFSLLGIFTQENLTWISGEGTAKLRATGRLDLNRATPLYALNATGEVNLEDAQVKSVYFSEPLIATGKATLNNQLINVEQLEGTFAEKNLSVTGTLPILYPVASIENPLTVNLAKGKIQLEELYKGTVAGNVIITGAALQPVIGGEVLLEKGKVIIPKQENNGSNVATRIDLIKNNNANSSSIITKLSDFQVKLEDLKIQPSPLYEFSIKGNLTLNGVANNPSNIQPKGIIYITRGDVDWLANNFTLVRSRENTVVFTPEAGLLNPYLDVQMQTEVFDINYLRQLEQNRNEIPDDTVQSGRNNIITVNLVIDGEAEELLPTLRKTATNCNIRPDNAPPSGQVNYTQTELNQLATCVNVAALNGTGDRNLLNSPAVQLTSTPSRSQGEIVSLLGNQFLSFAEELQNSNAEQLLNLGATQFVITPLQRRFFYTVEDFVVGIGKDIGLDYLRVYPYVEGIYEIKRDSFIRATYDYFLNEAKLEYQLRF
jgi:autotransporter translocation and assembly factor TamB